MPRAVLRMRGPTIMPASTMSPSVSTSVLMVCGSRVVVTPYARFTRYSHGCVRCTPHDVHMCAWMSTYPGRIVLPLASMLRAPAGTLSVPLGPTAAMRSSTTSTSARSMISFAFHRHDARVAQHDGAARAVPGHRERDIVARRRSSPEIADEQRWPQCPHGTGSIHTEAREAAADFREPRGGERRLGELRRRDGRHVAAGGNQIDEIEVAPHVRERPLPVRRDEDLVRGLLGPSRPRPPGHLEQAAAVRAIPRHRDQAVDAVVRVHAIDAGDELRATRQTVVVRRERDRRDQARRGARRACGGSNPPGARRDRRRCTAHGAARHGC